jgi:hypothetical protein
MQVWTVVCLRLLQAAAGAGLVLVARLRPRPPTVRRCCRRRAGCVHPVGIAASGRMLVSTRLVDIPLLLCDDRERGADALGLSWARPRRARRQQVAG